MFEPIYCSSHTAYITGTQFPNQATLGLTKFLYKLTCIDLCCVV